MSRDRDPNHLHPDIRSLYDQLLAWSVTQGLDVRPIAIWGSPIEQDALYAQGRTTPGKIVTYDQCSTSKHCFCLPDGTPASKAFDLGLFSPQGLYISSGNNQGYYLLGQQWLNMASANPDLELVWGGEWKTLKDVDHFQIA